MMGRRLLHATALLVILTAMTGTAAGQHLAGQRLLYQTPNGTIALTDLHGNVQDLGIKGLPHDVADYDNDGQQELIYSSLGRYGTVETTHLLESNGSRRTIYNLRTAWTREVGDMDGDGFIDLPHIFGYHQRPRQVYTLAVAGTEPGNQYAEIGYVKDIGDVGDIDGDGVKELIASEPVWNNQSIYVYNATAREQVIDVAMYKLGGMGNIDGDGDLDVAYMYDNPGKTHPIKYVDAQGNVGTIDARGDDSGSLYVMDLDQDPLDEIVRFNHSAGDNTGLRYVDQDGSVTPLNLKAERIRGLVNFSYRPVTPPTITEAAPDGTNINGSATLTATIRDPGNQTVHVRFLDGSGTIIDRFTLQNGSGTVSTIWRGLKDDQQHNWSVVVNDTRTTIRRQYSFTNYGLTLHWEDHSWTENGFRIYSNGSSDYGRFVQIGTVGPNTESFTYTSEAIQSGKYICHQVRAFNVFGESSEAENCIDTDRLDDQGQ